MARAIHHSLLAFSPSASRIRSVRTNSFCWVWKKSVTSDKPGTSVDSWGHVSFLALTRSFDDLGAGPARLGWPARHQPIAKRRMIDQTWASACHRLPPDLASCAWSWLIDTDSRVRFQVPTVVFLSRRSTDGNRYWGIDLSYSCGVETEEAALYESNIDFRSILCYMVLKRGQCAK